VDAAQTWARFAAPTALTAKAAASWVSAPSTAVQAGVDRDVMVRHSIQADLRIGDAQPVAVDCRHLVSPGGLIGHRLSERGD